MREGEVVVIPLWAVVAYAAAVVVIVVRAIHGEASRILTGPAVLGWIAVIPGLIGFAVALAGPWPLDRSELRELAPRD